jgi:TP901 family phage tail tape measure protein
MADVESNIHVNIDTSDALASLKLLQRQISAFHSQMAKSGAAASAVSANQAQNLMNSINATGKFQASMRTVTSSTESFTDALEKNKLTSREYFRYTGAATKTFGRLFKSEFDTISKVARERVKDVQTQYIKMGRGANGALQAIAVRPLTLDMKNLGTQTAMAAQKQQLLNQLLKQGSTNLLNFGKNTQWAGRQLMVGFTVPLAMLGTQAAKTFMAMEEQAIRFKRVYGELFTTAEETNAMVKDIQLLAREYTKYGVAVEETMKMAADAAAQGKMGADLMAQVAQATRLAVLGGVEQEQALETTISVTNAFGVATEDLAKKIDFLNAVENQTVVSIEDLTIAIPKAGPVVQQLGGDVEDLAFFLTAMKEGGINASEGANALKSGLASLINPSAKASAFLSELGINIKGIVEGNQGDVKSTVIDFAKALDTLDPLNRARAIEQLFGKFQFSRLSTLFQNVVAEGTQASRVLGLTKATTEELAILSERELSKIENTTTYKFKKSIEDLKVTLAPVGEQFLKALTPIVEFAAKILDKFNDLGDGSKKFITILTVALGAIGPLALMSFGLLANGVANIIKLFTTLRGGFQRAGSSTQILGEQTNYLTKEQLEASAVAASLDQVHQRLRQTFTSEASAVGALALAYQRAMAAQRAFGMPGAARPGVAPKKFAEGGIISGPGGPKSDSVPIMASNGEAIISAGVVEKYPGLVQGLIAGNVPGYKNSGIVGSKSVKFGGGNYSLPAGSQTINAIQAKIDSSIGTVDDIIAQALQNLASETKVSTKMFVKEVRRIAQEQGKRVADLGKEFASKSEKRVGGGGAYAAPKSLGSPAEQLRRERGDALGNTKLGNVAAAAEMAPARASAKAIRRTMEKYGATQSQIANATQIDRSHTVAVSKEQKGVKTGIKTGMKSPAWNSAVWTPQTGAENNSILESLKKSERYRKLYQEYLIKTGATETQITSIMSNINNGVALTDEQLSIQGKALRKIAADSKTNASIEKQTSRNFVMYADAVGQGALAREKVLARQPKQLRDLTIRNQKAIQAIADELPNAAALALQTQSPSKKMRKVGQDAGAGLVLGAREYVDDARATGQALGAATVQGSQSKAAASRTALYGTGPIDANQKSLRRQLQKQQKKSSIAQNVAYPGSVITSASANSSQKQTLSSRMSGFAQRRKDRKAARVESGKAGMGPGGGMMAASGVMMAASMVPGAVGDMSQKLMMPMMALTMILPLLQNKFSALAVGVGAVAAAYAYQRMQFDKAQDAALKLTEAMGAGTEAMKNLSTFAGRVSAGEIMDRRRKDSFSPFQIKTGKTTFGQSFMAGEQGKAMADNVAQTMKAGGKGLAKGQLVNQLATAVTSGALDAAQARSIVANLAQEMGDYSFGIEVNGKLNELLGPNGENVLKDPVGIRVKLLQDTRDKMNLSSTAAQKAGGWTGKDVGKTAAFSVGGGLAGAGAGAVAGGAFAGAATAAGIGAAAGSVVPVVGTIIGAALGIGVGAFLAKKDRSKRIGEASGASVAMQKIALQQQQEMMDSLELEYQNKLEVAKAAGDQAEAERLTNQYIKDRNTLLTENGKLVSDIQTSFKNSEGATRKALMTGADKAITKQYAGTALEDVAPLAQTQINNSGVSDELKYTLKMEMASGQIDPMQMIEIFETFGNDKAAIEKVVSVVGKFGGKFANQMMGIVGMFKDPKQATDFVARISTKTSAEAAKELALFQEISRLGAAIPDISVALDYYNKNPQAAAELQKTIDDINNQKGKISLEVATKILGAEEMAVLKADQEYFNSLPPEQQKVYLQTLTTMVNMEGNNQEAIQNWLKANPGKTEGDYYRASVFAVTESSKDDTAAPKTGNTSGGGSKVDSSPLDDLVKKLRDVRMNQLKVTEGWKSSQKALNKLFGGSKTIEIFSGIENDMRKLGAGEDLIDLITGMDPKEYEKRKNSLFEFDKKGNIKKIKDNARSIGDAIASISLGEFVSEQERMSKQIGNQTTALTRLKAAGIEGSVALEAVADATFAAAIANKKLSDKQVKQIAKTWKEATKNKKNYAAVQTIEAEKTALQERADLLTNITAIIGTLSEAERDAVLSNDALSSALANIKNLSPSDSTYKSFLDLIQKTLNRNRVELKINRLSLDGMQKIFDDGFNAAMDQLDVKEKTLQLKFEADTRGLQNTIDLAQDEVDSLQYSIDDQEAMLRGIEKQEQKINDKYDERLEALDQVEKANAAISAQQKGQLTLAEALTSGDIAAAARAAQEMRAQEAANAVTKEKEALEKSKEYELSKVRQDGKSRKDIEREIERLQDLVFIQEEKIEKDQEEIRKKNVALREAIKPIDVERARWEQMQNDIDVARTNNAKFLKLMSDAEAIVEELKKKYMNLKPDTDPIVGAGGFVPGPAVTGSGATGATGTTGSGATGGSSGNSEFRGNAGGSTDGPSGGSNGTNNSGSVPGFKETAPDPYKNTWMTITDPTARAHVKDMETNIAANIVRNSELFNREINKLKIEDNAGAVAKNHYTDLTRLTDAMNLAKKYNTGPDYARQQAENLAANKAAAAKKAADEATLKRFGGNAAAAQAFGNWSTGGLIPKYFAVGGFAKGTDTVPAMLTPGEFIMSKYAVDSYGVDNMRKINNGDSIGGTVYNNTYTLTVNAKTDANPNDIAQAVMSTIKRVDDRRIRGVSLNGR